VTPPPTGGNGAKAKSPEISPTHYPTSPLTVDVCAMTQTDLTKRGLDERDECPDCKQLVYRHLDRTVAMAMAMAIRPLSLSASRPASDCASSDLPLLLSVLCQFGCAVPDTKLSAPRHPKPAGWTASDIAQCQCTFCGTVAEGKYQPSNNTYYFRCLCKNEKGQWKAYHTPRFDDQPDHFYKSTGKIKFGCFLLKSLVAS
jgi:hypothetical protein